MRMRSTALLADNDLMKFSYAENKFLLLMYVRRSEPHVVFCEPSSKLDGATLQSGDTFGDQNKQ